MSISNKNEEHEVRLRIMKTALWINNLIPCNKIQIHLFLSNMSFAVFMIVLLDNILIHL